MKKIVYIILLLLVCSLMTACDEDPFKPVVSGDFIYSRVGVPVKGTVAIIGLSEEGKTKETLVFPTEIDGYRVFMIGTSFFMHRSSGSIFIEHAKNVYYTSQHDLVEVSIFYDRMTDDLNVFVGPRYPDPELYASSYSIKNSKVFVCKEYYDEMVELAVHLDSYNYTPANVAYYLDE